MQRKYIINLKNYGSMPNVVLSQYDDKYNLIFEVYDGNRPADLAGLTATLRGTRADGLKYSFTGAITGNVLTFAINTTLTGCAGSGIAELSITNVSGLNYGTYNFVVTIEKSPVPDDAIYADVTQAQTIQSQVQSIVNNAAATVRGEAEAWAIGERNGSAVPSSDETYHNNAKYYAEQARAAADSIGIDATLSVSGKAADAKKTGDEISGLKEDLTALEEVVEAIEPGLSNDAKVALLACFQHVAWADNNGATYYNTLRNILFPTVYPKIEVVYAPNNHVVYTDDFLDSIKDYMTVTYYQTAESSGTILQKTDYALFGTFVSGENRITVTYLSYSTVFTVTVVQSPVVGLNKYGSGLYDYSQKFCLITPRDNRGVIVTQSNFAKLKTKTTDEVSPSGVSNYSPIRSIT